MSNNPIIFLHLSDLHLNSEKDISDIHINKIADSLISYKEFEIENIIIIISGDITQSGKKAQFVTARKLIGSLIKYLKQNFKCIINVLVVPGNHDVDHADVPLDISHLKNQEYSKVEAIEHGKLTNFYNLAKFNNCFNNSELYYDIKVLQINNFTIQVNLINNAIYSAKDQYKGLLFIPDDNITELSKPKNANFIITIMHHAPDFYRDEIKNKIENYVISSSNILFHGHEHYIYNKDTSFNGAAETIIQSGGCICNNGDWSESSYIIGILNPDTLKYSYHKYVWNNEYKQYEHDTLKTKKIEPTKNDLNISPDFKDFIYEDYKKDYYVFPSIIYHGKKRTEDYLIDNFEIFKEKLLNHHYTIIIGENNIGKTTLLKHIFESLSENYYVIYGCPEKILSNSHGKKQNIKKLIKSLFKDIYGNNESKYQSFEQTNKDRCIFIFDDFENIDGINLNEFLEALRINFGTIILSTSHTIDFDPYNININEKDCIAKFEIKPLLGHKRRELIEAIVKSKADDKSAQNIKTIVLQIDKLIKTQLSIIPPEPYYIIQIAENFMNNVGEAIYKSTSAFSKVFEANLTNKIDNALKSKNRNKNITVELMYVIFRKIAYYIHFNKAYPIKRCEIENIINEYNDEYGNSLETEDILLIAKKAKVITDTSESRELFRFCNKSILAYFVAKEIISRKDYDALNDVINKACINICTDILLFIIYLTEESKIIDNILNAISDIISTDSAWSELSIPDSVPKYLKDNATLSINTSSVKKNKEKKEIEDNEEITEESIVTEFTIKDIYDWDDSVLDKITNKVIRMTSLLQIISRCFPCFEHLLKKSEKIKIINCIYTLPNRIFTFWSNFINVNYDNIIDELKTHPYFTNSKYKNKSKSNDKKILEKTKLNFSIYCMNTLLNLYYIPVLNATGDNTFQFLNNTDFFDFNQSITYQIENLMFLEQNFDSDEFITNALELKDVFNDHISSYLLHCIVRHGLIMRNDTLDNTNKLESKFFQNSKKSLLIERTKNKNLKK